MTENETGGANAAETAAENVDEPAQPADVDEANDSAVEAAAHAKPADADTEPPAAEAEATSEDIAAAPNEADRAAESAVGHDEKPANEVGAEAKPEEVAASSTDADRPPESSIEQNVESADAESTVPFVVEEWMHGALEALVFNSSEPLTPSRAREVLAAELPSMDPPRPEPGLGDVKAMFRTIVERWSNPERTVAHGFRIVDVDGGLTFRTAAANARFLRRMQMGKPQKLSRATLETLAVIAYKQPVTKPQIEEVRGVDSSGALKALLDKKLIRVLGKAEEIGRPLLYGTTKTFLELFEMQSLTDLPTLKELHELEHGISPEPVVEGDDRPAVVMDLFNADQVSAVSEETERESNEAMEALEKALGEAKDVAKRASTLVLGVKVDDDEDKKEPTP